jgi:lysophospholipase L1-like esterase
VPDIITFQLGVNDIAGANDENVHRRCEAILKNADELIAAARAGAPEAIMGVGLVTPGCSSQEGFGHDYNCGLTRWQYKKNQHTLNAAMLKHFADYPDKKVFIIPTSLNLDCENNFPVFKGVQCNGVHPTAAGYNQMGDTYYSWMKYWLSK